ncbi:MAG: hypothetical protein KatS3mg058_2839 [Roseiflexus sp.]|nr:MAG: hypothetical protein KatS3mg058_2839 [Roseiflexus sp.]
MPSPPAPLPHAGAGRVAQRSGPSPGGHAGFAVIARPAQPVEAIPSPPAPLLSSGAFLRDRALMWLRFGLTSYGRVKTVRPGFRR